MKIGIIGQGAIGSLFTYYWQKHCPILLLRNCPLPAKTLVDLSGIQHLLNNKQSLISKPLITDYEVLIIAVKGYQLANVIDNLITWLPLSTKLVLVQNGMGGADLLASHFKHNPIYVGTTTDAVYAQNASHFQVTAMGTLDIGLHINKYLRQDENVLNVQCNDIWASEFFNCHPQCNFHQDIQFALFRKLAINAVINPLTAVLKVRNGELVNHPKQFNLLKTEVFRIYDSMEIEYAPQALSNTINAVISSTANNYSSMYQDVHLGRQTEIDMILGYLLRQASLRSIELPFMQDLFERINTMDNALKEGEK